MNLKEKIYFIAGIETDIGKTFFLENIIKNLLLQKKDIFAIKPIISGFDINNKNSDSAKILQSLKQDLLEENFDKISPWRFKNAISPHFAADKEGYNLQYEKVLKFCQTSITDAKNNNKFLFIESAGGIMSPITYQKNYLDLAYDLNLPIILITANYLSSISHTLCAISAIKSKNLNIEKIIINDGLKRDGAHKIFDNHEEFAKTLKSFYSVEISLMSHFLT
jgi:dethiobiotin synthetase